MSELSFLGVQWILVTRWVAYLYLIFQIDFLSIWQKVSGLLDTMEVMSLPWRSCPLAATLTSHTVWHSSISSCCSTGPNRHVTYLFCLWKNSTNSILFSKTVLCFYVSSHFSLLTYNKVYVPWNVLFGINDTLTLKNFHIHVFRLCLQTSYSPLLASGFQS